MGKLVFFFIAAVLCFFILYSKGQKKLPWFFAGIIFFPHSTILFDTPASMSVPRIVTYVLIFAMLNENKWNEEFRSFPLRKAIIFLALMYLCIGLFDSRISTFHKFYRPFLVYVQNFFIMFLTYKWVKRQEYFIYLYKLFLAFFFIFCLYGLVNYLTKTNQYYSFISEVFHVEDYSNTYMEALIERFRISSFAWHAIYYGFLLSIAILISLFLFLNYPDNLSFRIFNAVVLFLLLVNLVLANSRTPIVALMAALSVVLLFGTKARQKLLAIGAVMALIFSVILIKPDVVKLGSETLKTFTSTGSNLEGSSLEMRTKQFNASVVVFEQSPVTGNGFNYITEGLGFDIEEDNNLADKDFEGFESYAYELLIELGICGMVANAFLFIAMGIFFYRKSKNNLLSGKIALLSISMLLAFLLFIFGTGSMNSFPFFMALMGVNIKAIVLGEQDYQSIELE